MLRFSRYVLAWILLCVVFLFCFRDFPKNRHIISKGVYVWTTEKGVMGVGEGSFRGGEGRGGAGGGGGQGEQLISCEKFARSYS